MNKISPNFSIEELVPPETFQKWGKNSIWFLDKRVVPILEEIRKDLGFIYINTWAFNNPSQYGGILRYCGYRPPDCTTGAKESQHRFGRGIDIHSPSHTAGSIRDYIRKNFKKLNELGLTTIEKDTPTWVHIDMRWTGRVDLLEVPYQ